MGIFKRPAKPAKGQKQFWYIRYYIPIGTDANGRRIYQDKWEVVGQVGIVTKSQAETLLLERKKQIKEASINPIIKESPTLSNFIPHYLKYQRDIKQLRSWQRDAYSMQHLTKAFGNTKLTSISIKDIDEYKMNRLKQGIKPTTINRELQCLRNLINVAKRWGAFKGDNPVSMAKLFPEIRSKRKIISLEEEKKLLEVCSPQLRALVDAALYTGMRISELLTLKKSNIDFTHKEIVLEAQMTKGKRERRIPIVDSYLEVLKERAHNMSEDDYVFTNSKGKPYRGHDSIVPMFRRACRRAGITGISFHSLRHAWITRALETGAKLIAVKEIAGHVDIRTTMRYVHAEESLRDAVKRIAEFRSKNSSKDNERNSYHYKKHR